MTNLVPCTPVVRCKMRVEEVLLSIDQHGQTTQERVILRPVSGGTPENEMWSKWTPSAKIEIAISNPDAMGKLRSTHEFYVDFSPVPAELLNTRR